MTSASWKRDFASGLIILLPVLVSVYVILYFYGALASGPFAKLITADTLGGLGLWANPDLATFIRVVTTLTVFVLLVFSIGYLMRTTLGDIFENGLDDLMNQVPGLRVVYNASKMAVETAVSGTEDLQTPVKVEPWNGVRMTAFKTGKTTGDGREILFLPTSPNITTGYVIEVDPDDYVEIDERVEDALTRVLSAGFGSSNEEQVDMDLAPDGAIGDTAETDGGTNSGED